MDSAEADVMHTALPARMADICGSGNVITDPQQLKTYECDGLTAHRSTPGLVVLPCPSPLTWSPRSYASAPPASFRLSPAAAAPACPAARCPAPTAS